MARGTHLSPLLYTPTSHKTLRQVITCVLVILAALSSCIKSEHVPASRLEHRQQVNGFGRAQVAPQSVEDAVSELRQKQVVRASLAKFASPIRQSRALNSNSQQQEDLEASSSSSSSSSSSLSDASQVLPSSGTSQPQLDAIVASGQWNGGSSHVNSRWHVASDLHPLQQTNNDKYKTFGDSDTHFYGVPRSLIKNVTVQNGQSVVLHCLVGPSSDTIVSWFRGLSSFELLAIENQTVISDNRFALRLVRDDDWALQIKDVDVNTDSGLYQCQQNTEPPKSLYYLLNIVDPQVSIIGEPEITVECGEQINLTCVISSSPDKLQFIFWYRNSRMINYDFTDDSKAKISTKKVAHENSVISELLIKVSQLSDSGNYTCMPSGTSASSVYVNVVEDLNQANAQAAKLKLKRQESRNKASTNQNYYQTTNTDDHNFNLLAPSSSRSQSSSAISSLALPELSTSTKAYATLALLSILLAWYQFFAQLQTCSSLLVVAFLGVCINKYATDDSDDEDNDNKKTSDVKGGKEDKSADGKASPSDESLQNGTNINDRSSPSVSKGKRSPTDADSGVECNDELVRLSADASNGDSTSSNLRRQQLLAKPKRRPAEIKASTNSAGNTQGGGNDMWLLTRRLTSALQLLKASSSSSSSQQQTGNDVRLASVSARSTPSPAHSVSLKQANTSSINSSNHEDDNDNDNDCHGQEQQMIQQQQPLLHHQLPKTALTIMMDEISMGNCSDRCTMSTSNMNQTYQSNNTSFGTDV